MDTDFDQRLTELEIRYTEQQAFLQQLSEALYAQQKELDRARSQIKLLEQKLSEEPGLVDAAQREKPPHY